MQAIGQARSTEELIRRGSTDTTQRIQDEIDFMLQSMMDTTSELMESNIVLKDTHRRLNTLRKENKEAERVQRLYDEEEAEDEAERVQKLLDGEERTQKQLDEKEAMEESFQSAKTSAKVSANLNREMQVPGPVMLSLANSRAGMQTMSAAVVTYNGDLSAAVTESFVADLTAYISDRR
jgi:hypothetical protein